MVSSSCTLFLLFCIQLPTQKPSLKPNLTSSKAQTPSDPPPVNIIQIFKTYNSTQLRGKPAKDWGAGRNRKKKCHSPGLNTWFLNSGSCKQRSHSGLPDSSSQGSSVKPADFCTILIPFFPSLMQRAFMQNYDRPYHKAFSDMLPQSRPFKFSNTNLATHFQKLQFCAILQSFPYEEGTKLKPHSFLSYGPNQYSPSLKNYMHKMRKNETSKLLLPSQYLY